MIILLLKRKNWLEKTSSNGRNLWVSKHIWTLCSSWNYKWCHHFFSLPNVVQVARTSKYLPISSLPLHIYTGRKFSQNLNVTRVRGSTNSPLGSSPAPGHCIHRRHIRLESLRTLILADNQLTRLSLYIDDNEYTLVNEVDENEVSIKLDIIFIWYLWF